MCGLKYAENQQCPQNLQINPYIDISYCQGLPENQRHEAVGLLFAGQHPHDIAPYLHVHDRTSMSMTVPCHFRNGQEGDLACSRRPQRMALSCLVLILFYFVFSFSMQGSLDVHLKKNDFRLRGYKIRLYTRQILEGLNYLHSIDPRILHRDIKCKLYCIF